MKRILLVAAVVIAVALLIYNVLAHPVLYVIEKSVTASTVKFTPGISIGVVCGNCTSIVSALREAGVSDVGVYNRVELGNLAKHTAVIVLDSNAAVKGLGDLSAYLARGGVVVVPRDVYLSIITGIINKSGTISVAYPEASFYIVRFFGYDSRTGRNLTAIVGLALRDLNSVESASEVLQWISRALNYRAEAVKGRKITISDSKIPAITAIASSGNLTVTSLAAAPGSYDPEWVVIGYISWSSMDSWKPYGKLNIEHALYVLAGDPYPNIDWFMVKATTEGVPGKVAWGEESYLEDFWNYYYLKNYTSIYELRDYDPSSYINPVTVSANLGEDVGVSISWTYPGNYIDRIDCYSDMSVDRAAWWHDIHSAPVTVKIEPGFEFTVSPPQNGTQRWVIRVQFFRYTWWGLIVEKFMATVYIDVAILYI
ncbi:hypothetical protein [Desulfurococcus amylolyticus]|uniref:Uncharacterized protein n=1 Tax=Desulfurococcus amylolyticus DSM 16532 TaxID=768672 RepID=I3XRK5_DESAM|nr:hypothetical protein [Desulfurococcus amylolyticus]AFL66579.1 hypothetical protein Desfe_0680 [Desulfurococcus amylolyticus DSM 16532]